MRQGVEMFGRRLFVIGLLSFMIAVYPVSCNDSNITLLINRANCTQADMLAINECDKFYPSELIQNAKNIDPAIPFFQANNSQHLDFKRICISYEQFSKCTKKFSPSTHRCYSNVIDEPLIRTFFAFMCQILEPLTTETSTHDCWMKSTKSCKLIQNNEQDEEEEEGSTEEARSGMCNLFESVELQINCALNDPTSCADTSTDVLRKLRSETSVLLNGFRCYDNVIDENDNEVEPRGQKEAKFVSESKNGTSSSNIDAPSISKSIRECNQQENQDGLLCLSEMWGIEKYFKDLNNGKFWNAVLQNRTSWMKICLQTQGYHQCMSKDGKNQDVGRCKYKSLKHPAAHLLKVLCDEEHLGEIKRNAECISNASIYFECSKNHDSFEENFIKVQTNNDQAALCSLFSDSYSFFKCFANSVNLVCESAVIAFDTLAEDVFKEAKHAECTNDSNNSTETASSEETESAESIDHAAMTIKPTSAVAHTSGPFIDVQKQFPDNQTVPPSNITNQVIIQTNAHLNVGSTVLNEELTSVESEKPAEDVCWLLNNDLCTGSTSTFGINPITVTDFQLQYTNLCNHASSFANCSKSFDCQSSMFFTGFNIALEYQCGSEKERFINSSECMKNVGDSKEGRECIKQFNDLDAMKNNTCNRLNEILECTYPKLYQHCGMIAADMHLNFINALTSSVDRQCKLKKPNVSISRVAASLDTSTQAAPPLDIVLADPVNCTEDESRNVEECVKPFKKVTDQFNALTAGGISALVKSLNNITQMFREGCSLRETFTQCVSTKVGFNTKCKISSCLIKLGETECVANATDRSLEVKIRCMFTLVAEPTFQECIKAIPKDAFSNFDALRKYLPALVDCLKEPILRKCGPDSLRLMKALSSSTTKQNITDTSCILNFDTGNEVSTSGTTPDHPESVVEQKIIAAPNNATSEAKVAVHQSVANGSVPLMSSTVDGTTLTPTTTSTTVVPLHGSSQQVASTTLAIAKEAETENGTICSTEQLDRYEDCAMVLSDYKPTPISIFDEYGKIDRACTLYNKYHSCLKKYSCRYPLGEAYRALLEKVCTDYYDVYRSNENCLRRAVFSRKMQTCIGNFQAINLRSFATDLNDRACKGIGDLLKCAGDDVDLKCGTQALDLLFSLYNLFGQEFGSNCIHSRTEIGAPMQQCLAQDRNAYFACRSKVPINPISILNDTSISLDNLCESFSTSFQHCISNISCLPQPAHEAFNDTMSYLCFSPSKPDEFKTHSACLSSLASSKPAEQCLKAFNDISWDDAGKFVCRKFTSVIDCEIPQIAEKCPNSLVFLYDLWSLFMQRYRVGCVLNVPQISTTKDPDVGNRTKLMIDWFLPTQAPQQHSNVSHTTIRPGGSCRKTSGDYATVIFGLIFVFILNNSRIMNI